MGIRAGTESRYFLPLRKSQTDMEITNKDIKAEILREMERQSITAYQLADEIGVKRQTLYSYLNGATEGINSVTLAKIVRRLGFRILSPGELKSVKSLL